MKDKEPKLQGNFLLADYDYYNRIIPMSEISGLRHVSGVLVACDGLTVIPDPQDNHLVKYTRLREPKAYPLTPHTVIGFAGTNIFVNRLEEYVDEISESIRRLKPPITMKDIADKAFGCLKDKFIDSAMAGVLIAGYGYDVKGNPSAKPSFFYGYFDKHTQLVEEDSPYYSSARESHRIGLRLAYEREKGEQFFPLKSVALATEILEANIRDHAQTDTSIAGYIRFMNITRGGITEWTAREPIQPQVKPGDRIV